MARESNWLVDIVMTRGAALNAKLLGASLVLLISRQRNISYILPLAMLLRPETPMRASFTTTS